jgi:hypothetical protein
MLFGSSAYGALLSTEDFNSSISGWSSATWDVAQKLRIEHGTTATKTYSFPSYANRVVFFSLDGSEADGAFDNEAVIISVNGTEVINRDLHGTDHYDFNATLDSDGNVTIAIFPDTNNNNEDLFIDNIVIDLPVVVNFEVGTYNVDENLSLADWQWEAWPITFTLSEPVAYPVQVDYISRDDSAIGGVDFSNINAHLIIPAGATSATRNIAIVHDPAIELIETFFIDLSNPGPAGSVIIGNIPTAQVNISAQVTAPICYQDDFETPLDADWRTLYSSGGFSPQIVDGRLRLTPDQTYIATAVTKDYEFRSQENLIIVEFTQYAWGGCDGAGSGDYGADGITAVLYDSAVGASPTPGALGGSMGYAQKTGTDGFEGGWLGLGIDEYGNFANPTEGRIGGPGFTTNAVSIRGDGSGTSGYEFLAGTAALTPALADKAATSPQPGHKYRMTTDARDPNHLYITLERDINDGNGYQLIINQFDAKDAQYNQMTTPDFVRFALTAGTGTGCNNHEIDDLTVRGVCRAYNEDAPTPDGADVVNNWIDIANYNSGNREITTKVAGDTSTITGVHIDPITGEASPFTANNPGLTFSIIPYLTNSSCTSENVNVWDPNTNQQLVIDLLPGETARTGTMIVPPHDGGTIVPKAYRDRRFEMIVVDSSLLSVDGQNCILTSSTTGNFARLSQCVNSETQYVDAFGQDAWNRCAMGHGEPCDSNNHGAANTTTSGTYDPNTDAMYANELGCYMCTFNIQPSCSSDNFAIRPEKFEITTTNPHYPDLLRSGQNYDLSISAYNYGTATPTYLYNQTDSNLTITQTKWLNSPRIEDTGNILAGNSSWASAFNIINGVSVNSFFNYDDVGYITLRVEDREWAAVDNDDTPQTCAPDGAYICGENNVTFIPHHFGIADLNVTNNNGNPGTFTYFSDIDPTDSSTFDMAAKIQVTIIAQNESNGTTANFRDGGSYYENQVSLTSLVTNPNLGDANTTFVIPTLLGFGTGTDAAGEKTIAWDETDTARVLRFNFPRTVNIPLNPVQINSLDVNVTAQSDYTQPSPLNSAQITGTDNGLGDTNTTFYYGRSHAPRTRIAGPDGNATFYYEIYCFGTDAIGNSCNTTLRDDITGGLLCVDDIRWFQNINHINTDGNISATSQKNGLLNLTLGAPVNGFPALPLSTVPYTYSGNKGYPYKTTMDVNSSDWLIFHKFNAAAAVNNFELEFNSAAGWGGKDESNVGVDSNAAPNTNRRIQW